MWCQCGNECVGDICEQCVKPTEDIPLSDPEMDEMWERECDRWYAANGY